MQQKILLIGGVSLVKGRIPDAGVVMQEICNQLEPLLAETGYIDNAPFKTVSLILRFGEKTDFTPIYEPINKRYSELPVAVELQLAALRSADKDTVINEFFSATIGVLIDVARKYSLPFGELEKIKNKKEQQ